MSKSFQGKTPEKRPRSVKKRAEKKVTKRLRIQFSKDNYSELEIDRESDPNTVAKDFCRHFELGRDMEVALRQIIADKITEHFGSSLSVVAE